MAHAVDTVLSHGVSHLFVRRLRGTRCGDETRQAGRQHTGRVTFSVGWNFVLFLNHVRLGTNSNFASLIQTKSPSLYIRGLEF